MATFLFWNVNGKRVLELLASLVRAHRVDVLVLAECALSGVELLEALNPGLPGKLRLAAGESPRLKILTRYPKHCVRPLLDKGGIAIRRLHPPVGCDILLVAVHLPSKLHQSDAEQVVLCTEVAGHITDAEMQVGHTRTLVLGDLNMNPFDDGVVAAGGLHAVMDKRVAAKGARTVQGKEHVFFYNPMWSLLGDASPCPAGTYYYHSARRLSYYWNAFDQVLVRPDLLDMFGDEDVRVVTEADGKPLLSRDGIPRPSDHLPILFRLGVERG